MNVWYVEHVELDLPRKAKACCLDSYPAVSENFFSLFSVRWERRDYTMQKHESADLKSESLQHTRVLVGVALFMALDVLLGSLSINLTETLRISFTFLGVAASCYFLVCGQMFLPLFWSTCLAILPIRLDPTCHYLR